MEEIKVFGPEPGCIKCKKTLEVVQTVADELGLNARKYDVFSEEADKYDIMMTPAVVFRDTLLVVGKVPNHDSLKQSIEDIL